MLEIQEQFIDYNKSSRSQEPIYIVIHDTGSPGGTAQNNHDYFSGGNRGASADFFVDSDNIIQIMDTDNFYSWQVGDGHGAYGISNSNSVGIEMCIGYDNIPTEATVANTIDLVKYLMNKYNIGTDNVVRHYDASRKCCPNCFSENNWSKWFEFKERITNGGTKQGWNKNANGWWYCTDTDNGYYYKSEWKQIDNEWYYFDDNGYAVANNWKQYKDKWYYLDEDCKMVKNKWIWWDGECYYLNSDGAMSLNTTTPDGYKVDETGAWIQ